MARWHPKRAASQGSSPPFRVFTPSRTEPSWSGRGKGTLWQAVAVAAVPLPVQFGDIPRAGPGQWHCLAARGVCHCLALTLSAQSHRLAVPLSPAAPAAVTCISYYNVTQCSGTSQCESRVTVSKYLPVAVVVLRLQSSAGVTPVAALLQDSLIPTEKSTVRGSVAPGLIPVGGLVGG